jgi:hypothetical protein
MSTRHVFFRYAIDADRLLPSTTNSDFAPVDSYLGIVARSNTVRRMIGPIYQFLSLKGGAPHRSPHSSTFNYAPCQFPL